MLLGPGVRRLHIADGCMYMALMCVDCTLQKIVYSLKLCIYISMFILFMDSFRNLDVHEWIS